MNLSTLLVLAPVAAALAFAVRYVLKNGSCGGCPGSKRCRAAKAQGGCGGSCSSCHGCSMSTAEKPATGKY